MHLFRWRVFHQSPASLTMLLKCDNTCLLPCCTPCTICHHARMNYESTNEGRTNAGRHGTPHAIVVPPRIRSALLVQVLPRYGMSLFGSWRPPPRHGFLAIYMNVICMRRPRHADSVPYVYTTRCFCSLAYYFASMLLPGVMRGVFS